MTPDELEATLLRAFPGAEIEITDLTGTANHYQARIVAPAFEGKNKLAQHRMVYAAVGDAMKGVVHALALNTYTPAEWQRAAKG